MAKCYVTNRVDPTRLSQKGLDPCTNDATTILVLPTGSSHPVCTSCAEIFNRLIIPLLNTAEAIQHEPRTPLITIPSSN